MDRLYQALIQILLAGISLLKVLLRSRLVLPGFPVEGQKRCVILGNGPSLKKAIEAYGEQLKEEELFCVNHFPKTEAYVQLKPGNFVTSAPELWRDNMRESVIESREKLWAAMVEKTDWPMHVFLPAEAGKCKWLMNQLGQNRQLKIVFYNNTAVEGSRRIAFFLFRRNLGIPRPHNVLIPSLMLSINSGYREVVLLGADHSWLEELSVNDKNEALLNQKHFYDADTSRPDRMYRQLKRRPRRVHEILEKLMFAFRSYFEIRDYAETKGTKIINATPGSYIDAFEREILENVLDSD
jgi:hypothetical protein